MRCWLYVCWTCCVCGGICSNVEGRRQHSSLTLVLKYLASSVRNGSVPPFSWFWNASVPSHTQTSALRPHCTHILRAIRPIRRPRPRFLFYFSPRGQFPRHRRLSLHRDSDGGLRKTRHADGTTITTTTLRGLAFATLPPHTTTITTAAASAAGSRQARIRRPRQRDGCPPHTSSSSSLSLLSPPPPRPPPYQGLRASIVPPGAGGMAGQRRAGSERDGGGFLSSSSSSSSTLGVVSRLGEGGSSSGRSRSLSTSGSGSSRRRSSTISSEVSSASNSGSSQGQGYGAGHQGRNGSQAAAAGVWTGRARFSGRPGVVGDGGGGGVRSGGAMAHELRPLLDMLDCARGHRATGAAAMKVICDL